jgi:hypothetical protein
MPSLQSGKGKGKAKEGATTLKTKPTQSFFNFFGRGAPKGRKRPAKEAEEDEDAGSDAEAGDVPAAHAEMILAIWSDVRACTPSRRTFPCSCSLWLGHLLKSIGVKFLLLHFEWFGSKEEMLPES